MDTRTVVRDVLIIIVVFIWPFLIPVTPYAIFPSMFTGIVVLITLMTLGAWVPTFRTDVSIRWGLHPCSDGHDMELDSVEEDQSFVGFGDGLKPEGLQYTVTDIENHSCSRCYKTSAERTNERTRIADSVGVDVARDNL